MTDYELIVSLATALRAYSTAPLANCEVHPWSQIGYEDSDGSVIIEPANGGQGHIAIGDGTGSLMDSIGLVIFGYLPHADTATSNANIGLLRAQIVSVLRNNRTLAVGDESARTNARDRIGWTYGRYADGPKLMNFCRVTVTYEYEPDAAS